MAEQTPQRDTRIGWAIGLAIAAALILGFGWEPLGYDLNPFDDRHVVRVTLSSSGGSAEEAGKAGDLRITLHERLRTDSGGRSRDGGDYVVWLLRIENVGSQTQSFISQSSFKAVSTTGGHLEPRTIPNVPGVSVWGLLPGARHAGYLAFEIPDAELGRLVYEPATSRYSIEWRFDFR